MGIKEQLLEASAAISSAAETVRTAAMSLSEPENGPVEEPGEEPKEEPKEEPGEEPKEEPGDTPGEAGGDTGGDAGDGGGDTDAGGDTGGGGTIPTPPVTGANTVTSWAGVNNAIKLAKANNQSVDLQVSGHLGAGRLISVAGSAVVRLFPKDSSAALGETYGTGISDFEMHGMTFSHKNDGKPSKAGVSAFARFDPGCRRIIIDDCEFFGRSDAKPNGPNSMGQRSGGYYDWSRAEWQAQLTSGVNMRAADSRVRRNKFYGIYHGVAISEGGGSVTEFNEIWGFGGDALRLVIGDNHMVMDNKARDCFKVNSNHDDSCQSWSMGPNGVGTGVVKNGYLARNSILEWTGPANHPLIGRLQGIDGFDGAYEDFLVEDNLLVLSAYHGITYAGPINCVVRRNVVLRRDKIMDGKSPWVSFGAGKKGQPVVGGQITDNVAASIRAPSQVNASGNVQPNYTDPTKPNYYDVDSILASA